MKLKIVIGIVAVAVAIVAMALIGMWLDFCNLEAVKWHIGGPKGEEGYEWLTNNTEGNATVLAWWDYADGIQAISHRKVVIKEASENIKETIAPYNSPGRPWRKIEYELWYPFESEDKVRDVANFFIAENSNESIRIARNYGANYVLVVYPDDIWKFPAIVLASGKEPDDYITGNFTIESIERREVVKKETVGIKMIYGDNVEGFEKVFDNRKMRIYKLK